MIEANSFDLSFFEENSCELCGSSNLKKLEIENREGFDVRYAICTQCSLVFASRYMDNTSLTDFYQKHYSEMYPSHNLTEAKRKKLTKRLQTISRLFSERPSIMDYGCGDGAILDSLNEDCSVCLGLDYVEAPIVTKSGSKIIPISHLEKVSHKFDVALMSQVLEHLQDPLQTLIDISHCLKKGGLLIVEVPGLYSFSSVKSEKSFKDQFKLCHKTYFTKETLSLMLKQAGFRVVYSDHSARAIAVKTGTLEFTQRNTVIQGPNLEYKKPYRYRTPFFKLGLIANAIWMRIFFGIIPKVIIRPLIWRN